MPMRTGMRFALRSASKSQYTDRQTDRQTNNSLTFRTHSGTSVTHTRVCRNVEVVGIRGRYAPRSEVTA